MSKAIDVNNRSQALIVAYYLSKFDSSAYTNLGYGGSTAAHNKIGELLDVKSSSVKNMRDEFDPLHDNPRVGWYQRPLRPSRAKVVEAYQNLSEFELHEIVLEILSNTESNKEADYIQILQSELSKEERISEGKRPYIIRGPTGRKAEEFFMQHHSETGDPLQGDLIDTRDLGCGYDFEIKNDEGVSGYVEVKGLASLDGGVTFTSKEWQTANELGEFYFLVIVRNIDLNPEIQVMQDPSSKLEPKKSIYTTVQIGWNVSKKDLASE